MRAVEGGQYHNLFHYVDGRVAVCGWNTSGQLGALPTNVTAATPYVVPGIAGVRAIAAGITQSYVLSDGESPYIRRHPTPLSRAVRVGDSLLMEAEAVGLPLLAFQWQKGLEFLGDTPSRLGTNTQALAINPVRSTDAGTYVLNVANHLGVVQTLPVTVSVSGLLGDLDGDADIDLEDYGDFHACMSAPGVPPQPTQPGLTPHMCLTTYDRDGDGDVDYVDFALLQPCFAGEDVVPVQGCDGGIW